MLYGGRQGSLFGRLGPKVVLAGSMAAAALTVLLFLGLRTVFGERGVARTAGSGDAASGAPGATEAAAAPSRAGGSPREGETKAAGGALDSAASLPLAARKMLPGEEMIGAGKAKEALAWAESFSGPDSDRHKVLLIKARAMAQLGRTAEAKQTLESIASANVPESAEARLELLRMSGKPDVAVLREIWSSDGRGRAGTQAAMMLADSLWENSRRKASVSECAEELEECRRAYSAALLGRDISRADADRIIARMDTLNRVLIFNKAIETSNPKSVVHTVQSGESPASIAAKYKVPVGQVARLNGMAEKAVLQVGQRLKLLPGKWRLLVNRSSLDMLVFWEDTFIKKYPVGIGPGDATPLGTFVITKKTVNPDWYYNGQRIPFGNPKNILGTRWMGFDPNGPGRGFGVHGTSEPDSVPGRKSKGCIRMLNPDVEELYDLAPTGTIVEIVD